MAKPSADVGKYDKAVDAFRRRVPVTPDEWDALDAEARERAFTIANIAQLALVSQVWEELDRAISDGTDLGTFQGTISDKLTAAWGQEKPWHVETIFRTNVQKAYSDGRWEQLTSPAVKRVRPFWKYSAILDGRETDVCRSLHGTTLPADDTFWQKHNPPCHFNCRSSLISLTVEQVDETGGADVAGPRVQVPEGFGRAPDAGSWAPDLTQYPAALVGVLRARHG